MRLSYVLIFVGVGMPFCALVISVVTHIWLTMDVWVALEVAALVGVAIGYDAASSRRSA